MKVILCEKPDQAASVAAALQEVRLANGEILKTEHLSLPRYERFIKEARKEGYFRGANHLVTYAYGHLFELKEPQEIDPKLAKWSMDTLPFIFPQIPLKGISGPKGMAKRQFGVIKKLFTDPSVEGIIVSTDAGREGEHIFRTIYQMSGSRKPFERMWLKDMTEEGILEAYQGRQPGSKYDAYAAAALCRAEADYLVGMNLSRAMTLQFGGFKNVISIGRVQTPTLAILVNREREIQRFVPEDYFTVKTTLQHPKGTYEATWFQGNQERFSSMTEAQALVQKVQGQPGTLTQVDVKEEQESNPLLFNLTELAKVMGRVKGFTPSKTLQIAQALYDQHKLITYPRSSSRYVATGTGKQARTILQNLATTFPQIVTPALQQGWRMAPWMVNDAKTSDHEAIIPTRKVPDLKKLNGDERAMYEVIVKRFVASFYQKAVWTTMKTVTTVAGETFKANGKSLKEPGWRSVEGIPNTTILPALVLHDAVTTRQAEAEKKQTQPPKRILESDLPDIMDTAGRLIEDDTLKEVLKGKGLGTEATRAKIIEELIRREYVRREKKALVPTEKGMQVLDILPVEPLAKPEMTAEWEQKLAEVEAGQLDRPAFMRAIEQALTEWVHTIQQAPAQKIQHGSSSTSQEVLCQCPACGGEIVENAKAYGCKNWMQGCKETIWKNQLKGLGKPTITKTQAKQLFEKKKTTKKVKLRSKAGKEFEAYLTYQGQGKIELKF